jgi:hypothetical protein
LLLPLKFTAIIPFSGKQSMKSEERHQLETNVLASELDKRIEQVKPMIGWIVLAVLAVTGVVLVWGVVSSLHEQREAAAWNGFYLAAGSGDAAQLEPLIEEYPTSTAAGWARQIVADSDLQKGTEALLVDKDEANELLKKAVEGYEQLLADSTDASLQARSQIGLAQAYESLGEVEKAVEAWEEVAKDTSSEAFSKFAKGRIEWLASSQAKSFYQWFGNFKPEPKPQINIPSDLNSLPTSPDIKLPELTPFTPPAPAGNSPAPAVPATDAPAVPATDAPAVPATDAPAVPATDTPAVPATDTPAVPATDTPAVPATDTPAVPATDTPAVPATDTPAVPATDTPAVPATDTPAVPATDTPAVPATDTPAVPAATPAEGSGGSN